MCFLKPQKLQKYYPTKFPFSQVSLVFPEKEQKLAIAPDPPPKHKLPFMMTNYIQSVAIQRRLYLGGGVAADDADRLKIMYYDIPSEEWGTLPRPYRAIYFAMAAIKDQLVLVGGLNRNGLDGKPSHLLGAWDGDEWTCLYPGMPTARCGCSAVVYNEWLVVAGGISQSKGKRETLSSVEVLNTNSKQWYTGHPTLRPLYCMKTAVVGDKGFFMGGTDETGSSDIMDVYQVNIRNLINNLSIPTQDFSIAPKACSKIWEKVSGLLFGSTPISIGGSLLAVGGVDKNDKFCSAIHLYNPDTEKWEKEGVGVLPTPRRYCTCEVISDREVLVAGGEIIQPLPNVDFGLINLSLSFLYQTNLSYFVLIACLCC